MFDMKENSGGNEGYQLRITYRVKSGKFSLSGYVIFMDQNNRVTYDLDGEPLVFDSLEKALEHIQNYGTK